MIGTDSHKFLSSILMDIVWYSRSIRQIQYSECMSLKPSSQ